ncbi:hypothetical protein RBSH_00365 [Rhodopirellula baltica SH28]|uniref:Uncharacterized protein n=2 Tax=Rhodopirellula baltica TaxID=265606 RepID=K5DPD6_RHOBT|nr:hypothetical protein RBSH_00365 [Rhodopirellula baltica SH28]ELP30522.1 hypothetical protein RBSWK_05550 [Rhodopirellula baltica SWK14]
MTPLRHWDCESPKDHCTRSGLQPPHSCATSEDQCSHSPEPSSALINT